MANLILPVPYFFLEIKYLKKSHKKEKGEAIVKDAEAQLGKYTLDEKLKKSFEGKTLIKLVLAFAGSELKYIGEAPRRGDPIKT